MIGPYLIDCLHWLVMYAFYARLLIFSIIEHFCLDCTIVKTPIFVMTKWGEMSKEASFELTTKVLSAVFYEEAFVKMKIYMHKTRLHFAKWYNQNGNL